MRHRYGFNELSRDSAERKALLRSQCTSLVLYERIVTTLAKAKETQRRIERLVTRAKNANNEIAKLSVQTNPENVGKANAVNVHAHRQVARHLYTEKAVAKLFNDIAPLFAERNGGYTRIIKCGYRNNDSAQLAILEFVERPQKEEKAKADKKVKDKTSQKASKAKKEASERRGSEKVKQSKGVSEKVVTRQKKGN